MGEQLSFDLKLTLEDLTLRKVVVCLWNASDILSTIQNFLSMADESILKGLKDNSEWRETIEGKVRRKISTLALPELLKRGIMNFVRPVGYQILRWNISHREFNADILQHLCWTPLGTIDYKRTAGRLVRLETFHVEERYKLACSYCLEDYLPLIWSELSVWGKRRFYVELSGSRYSRELPLETYWAYVLKGEESKVNCFDASEFRFSARTGNKAASEYFFQKLSNEERASSLHQEVCSFIEKSQSFMFDPYPFKHEKDSETLCYLLSKMNRKKQMKILEKYPLYALMRFLYWPWQDLFLDVANLILTLSPRWHYGNLIYNICVEMRNARYYSPHLIQKAFLLVPKELRKHFVRSFLIYSEPIFSEISDNEDTETIKVFLRNVDPECRPNLVLEKHFLLLLHHLVTREKWRFVEECIREASLSREHRERVKEELLCKFQSRRNTDRILSHRLKLLFQFLDANEAGIGGWCTKKVGGQKRCECVVG